MKKKDSGKGSEERKKEKKNKKKRGIADEKRRSPGAVWNLLKMIHSLR